MIDWTKRQVTISDKQDATDVATEAGARSIRLAIGEAQTHEEIIRIANTVGVTLVEALAMHHRCASPGCKRQASYRASYGESIDDLICTVCMTMAVVRVYKVSNDAPEPEYSITLRDVTKLLYRCDIQNLEYSPVITCRTCDVYKCTEQANFTGYGKLICHDHLDSSVKSIEMAKRAIAVAKVWHR